MNTFSSRLTAFLLILIMAFGACTKDASLSNNPNFSGTELSSANNGSGLLPQVAGGKYIKDAYIVVLKDEVTDVDGEVGQMVRGLGGAKPDHVYKHAIKGFSIKVPAAAIQGLSKHPKVASIEQDQVVTIDATTQSNATWGLDRVDQLGLPLNKTYEYTKTGSSVHVYIFDTGIRGSHTEFKGRMLPGYFVSSIATSTDDRNGHGTHVAGTVGGTVYGVAKGVKLVPVKVLSDRGSGTNAGVIAGVDWAVGKRATAPTTPAVGNMSLGGGISSTLDQAVKNAVAAGIVMCVAGGNSTRDVIGFSPARVAEAITVGATTSSDAIASYSNFGPTLDIFAPGSSITSAGVRSNTAIATLSGTSMASPHVAGVAALYLDANPTAMPAHVESALKAAATPNMVKGSINGSPNLLLYSRSF